MCTLHVFSASSLKGFPVVMCMTMSGTGGNYFGLGTTPADRLQIIF